MSDTPAIPASALDAEGNDPTRREGPATPAATVIALRDGPDGPEALLLRRQRGGAFSGMWVFPGGKVEPGDAELAGVAIPGGFAAGHLAADDEIAVARHAAVREAMEEAELLLAPDDLAVHSYWMPPPEAPRRFSTWFFVAPASEGDIVVDQTEVHEHRWLTPAAAIRERDAGKLALAPPTWMTLWQIGQHPDVASVLAEARSRPPLRFETHLRATGGGRSVLVWDGDAAYDGADLNTPGARRRLWLSDEEPWRPEVGSVGGS